MRARLRTATGVALMCVSIGTAACGSDDSSKSDSPSASSQTAAQTGTSNGGPKGEPFVLGTICSCSGPQAAAFGSVPKVAQAWADSVNAAGGINGHPVKLIVKDDGSDPAKALQVAKELVVDDKVMAIVGSTSLVTTAWADYVAEQDIPVTGGLAYEAPFSTNPDFFASGGSLPVTTLGMTLLAAGADQKKAGLMYCAETPICKQLDPIMQFAATSADLDYASLAVSGTAPSYAAPCLKLKDEGVDTLFIAHNASVYPRIVEQCIQQGFEPTTIAQFTAMAPNTIADSNLDGALLTGANANAYDDAIPGVKTYLDAVDEYAPGLRDKPEFSYNLFATWVGAQLFAAAAKAGDLTPASTSEDIKKGLYALKDETLDGIAPPLNYTPGKPAFPVCYFTGKLENSELVSLNGGKPSCLSEAQVGELTKALAG